jgi:hypothetical protein
MSYFTKETITVECKHIVAEEELLSSTQQNATIPFDPRILHPQWQEDCTRKSFQVVEQNVNPL